ncbi:MAG: DUF6340 family protein [Bacteroidota bacterium]|nr:DUF6340 family protein [Bacteroidota bacterium]
MNEVFVRALQPGVAGFSLELQNFTLADMTGSGKECLKALQWGLAKDSFFNVSIFGDSGYIAQPAPELSWEKVAQLLQQDTTAGLIVLEERSKYFRVDPYTTVRTKYTEYNSRSGVYRTVIRNTPRKDLYYTYKWKVYDLKTKTVFGPFFCEYPDSSTTYAGQSFAIQLLPHSMVMVRKYYNRGGKNMRDGAWLVRQDQWEKARGMWLRESIKGSKRAKRKAYFNLAIYEEKAGNFAGAIEYAAKAKYFGDEQAEFYLLLLQHEQRAWEIQNSRFKMQNRFLSD